VATIKRYLKQRRETGQVTAKPIPGRPPKQRAALEAELPGQLAAYRDVTLAEHCRLFEASHGQRVSRDTMRRAIDRLGWTWKKNRWWPPSEANQTVPLGTS
jgi:transposase